MPVRLFGVKGHFRGKSLGEIVAKLKNVDGRVVARSKLLNTYPEKCYNILTRAETYCDGQKIIAKVWGYQVFRGYKIEREKEIHAYFKKDWILIPKEDEEEFCKIDKVHTKTMNTPKWIQLPPTMQQVVGRTLKKKNVPFQEPIRIERVIKRKSQRDDITDMTDATLEDIKRKT